MRTERDETQIQQFYEQWAPQVRLFCQLYTGDSQTADNVVEQTFLRYCRSDLPLVLDDMPIALMAFAVEESTCSSDGAGRDAESDFEWAVLLLPPSERAVFILHATLGLQLPRVAAITSLLFTAACQLWARALLRLQIFTVKDDRSRLFENYGIASKDAALCA